MQISRPIRRLGPIGLLILGFGIASAFAFHVSVSGAAAPADDSRCPTWLSLRATALHAEALADDAAVARFAAASADARLACARDGREPITADQRFLEARDLLRAAQFAHQAGELKYAAALMQRAIEEDRRAVRDGRHTRADWLDEAKFDYLEAISNVKNNEWPVFDPSQAVL